VTPDTGARRQQDRRTDRTAQALLDRWAGGGTAHGAWCLLADSFAAELAAASGPDYVCLDMQHGLIGGSDLLPPLQAVAAAGTAALVRVASNSASAINQVLDWGAAGVIVPLVNDAEEAARAAAACRFSPDGTRSWGPVRAAVSRGEADPRSLGRVACFVMVETAAGLANLPDIAATPGITGIYVGPSDLSLALGLAPSPEQTHPRFLRALEAVVDSCERNGIVPGIHAVRGATARQHQQRGFRMLTVGVDCQLLKGAFEAQLAEARAAGTVDDGSDTRAVPEQAT
jgi:4-hydroxy-2-oxoheptanedioate aldolase